MGQPSGPIAERGSRRKRFERAPGGGYFLRQRWLSYPRYVPGPAPDRVEPTRGDSIELVQVQARLDRLETELRHLRGRVEEREGEAIKTALDSLTHPSLAARQAEALLMGDADPEPDGSDEPLPLPQRTIRRELTYHALATLTFLTASFLPVAAH